MNDSTKDDLLILFKCARISEMEYGESPDLDNIKFKLQSLIDNYCEHKWIKRQKPKKDNGNWIGQPWPTSPWALFRDVNGNECLSERIIEDNYQFNNEIDVYRLCMFKELYHDDLLVKEYLKDKNNREA